MSGSLKVSEALGNTDVDQIRVPAVLTLALLNLERVIKRTKTVELGYQPPACPGPLEPEQHFADTLAKKCDELQTKNEALSLLVETP